MVNTRLYASANELIASRPEASVDDLLGKSVTKTENLDVPDGFLFDSSWQLKLNIDVTSMTSEESYLLICSDFNRNVNAYDVDYRTCQLNTPLSGGIYKGELKMTGAVTKLLAVILPLKNPGKAIYATWDRNEDGDLFRVR